MVFKHRFLAVLVATTFVHCSSGAASPLGDAKHDGTTPSTPAANTNDTVDSIPPSDTAFYLAACSTTAANGNAFVAQPEVTYLILHATADQALQIADKNSTSGAAFTMATRTNGMHQLFIFATSGGAYAAHVYHSGLRVGLGSNGGLQQLTDAQSSTAWSVAPRSGGYALVDSASGQCLTNRADSTQTFRVLPFKKGMSVYGSAWAPQVQQMQPFWIYDWGTDTGSIPVPTATEFVPMVWGYYGDANGLVTTLQAQVQKGARHVLGYNEPDNSGQANLDPNVAASTWPMFEACGLPLGGPAAANAADAWVQTFFSDIGGTSHVSFLTVHWYGGVSADSFISYLTGLHEQYGLPIWITEFAPADWNAASTAQENYTAAQVQTFLQQLLPQLDALPWIQRFAYFNGSPTDAALGHSVLYNADGSLSGAGSVYMAYPFGT